MYPQRENEVQEPWLCPKCYTPLVEGDKALVCEHGHHYDIARQGYVNLLLANQKKSKNPGDSPMMMAARRAFLAAGHYQRLVKALSRLIQEQIAERSPRTLFDIGCGEGSYLKGLNENGLLSGLHCYGVDISKAAITKAAPYAKFAQFAVASSANLPVREGSVDIALSVFAPLFSKTLKQALAKKAVLIRVLPGETHLLELKQLIFNEVRLHKPVEVESGFSLIKEEKVQFDLNLDTSEDLARLLTMIPLAWRAKAEDKCRALTTQTLKVRADFVVQVLELT